MVGLIRRRRIKWALRRARGIWRAVRWPATTWARPTAEKTLVRGAFEHSWNKREIVRQDVVVRALRKLRCDARPSVAFVQIACTFHILVIGNERAVILAARTVRTRSDPHAIAGAKSLDCVV